MDQSVRRSVTAVVTFEGETLGEVGPFEVDHPRWQEVGPVARGLEQRLGVPVLVLRLVSVTGGEAGRGGHVVYHAEALRRPEAVLDEGSARLAEDPLRAVWATADGLRAALAWAEEALRDRGRPATGPAEQVKSWNLSGLVRIPTADGPAWLKTTPPFGTDEHRPIALVASLDPALVPGVIAAAPGRLLLEHVPGEDCWGLPEDAMLDAIGRTVAVQAGLAAALTADPAARGLRDRSPRRVLEQARELLPRLDDLSAEEHGRAGALLAALPAVIEALDACGLPLTLVHGDFHPGNYRSDGSATVLVDFSDAFFGHPAFDGLRPQDFLGERRWADVRAVWAAAWSAAAPGSDPLRALELAAPLVHLGYAVRYQEFLDGIERSERIYHEGDPASEVRAALAAADALSVPGR
ncbi:aminoglycoside phosphotransferase family protein [Kitasatospora sp. DSM 101779]|uniref:aminoglycoside phosphotransferase family protein n=1 Tax=Kitasatospora sp. DSM 101779 TaxID=2853165 RepID=UPI0021DA00DA|nr:aminoglycoside phosphotransferase family protein [Kitasatospora sp. DSM 101779]